MALKLLWFRLLGIVGALVAGQVAKLMLILLLLVVEIPVRKATSYLDQHGLVTAGIADLIDIALPLLALFLLINFINAIPRPDKREST